MCRATHAIPSLTMSHSWHSMHTSASPFLALKRARAGLHAPSHHPVATSTTPVLPLFLHFVLHLSSCTSTPARPLPDPLPQATVNSLRFEHIGFITEFGAWWTIIGVLIVIIAIPAISREHADAEWVFRKFESQLAEEVGVKNPL